MIAHQLNGDLNEALNTYDGLISCVKSDGATGPEKAQTLMHVVKICMEAGNMADGLRRLEDGFREGVISRRGEATQLHGQPKRYSKKFPLITIPLQRRCWSRWDGKARQRIRTERCSSRIRTISSTIEASCGTRALTSVSQ